MTILFDNYDGYDFEQVKADLLENNGWDDISDENVYSAMSDLEYEDWLYCKSLLRHAVDGKILTKGKAGRWYGNRAALKLFDDIDAAIDAIIQDCDYIRVWEDKNHLYIRASHHDGTNEFEIKQVTPDGERIYHNWNYSYDPRTENLDEWQILDKMWNSSKYSHIPEKGLY